MESDTFGIYAKEAQDLKNRAEEARQLLRAGGEGGEIPFIDEDDAERNEEGSSYFFTKLLLLFGSSGVRSCLRSMEMSVICSLSCLSS